VTASGKITTRGDYFPVVVMPSAAARLRHRWLKTGMRRGSHLVQSWAMFQAVRNSP